MNLRLQIILICLWIFILFRLIIQMKKRVVDIKNSLKWLALDLVLLIFTVFPGIIYYCSSLLGIEIPSNMLFFFGFILLLLMEYSHTAMISKMIKNQRELIQNVGIKDYEIKNMKK